MAAPVFEELPTYFNCVSRIYNVSKQCFAHPGGSFSPLEFFRQFAKVGHVTNNDIIVLVVLSICWTLLRRLLNSVIFVPFAKWMKLLPNNIEKFPESAWKFCYYSCTFAYLCYILFLHGDYDYFYRPLQIWSDWKIAMHVPFDLRLIYWVECSFYVHSIYATLFMDVWRKDSVVMIFHHFLTIGLLFFSYSVRYHKIGILVLFVHDVTDVCLEFTKCNAYLKQRDGKFYKSHDMVANMGFLSFATTWFIFRLYWYPLKILYSAGYGGPLVSPDKLDSPFYFFFNFMLWILLLLNIYWFGIILEFISRVILGKVDELEDIRETSEQRQKMQ